MEIAKASGKQVYRADVKEGMVCADSRQCKEQETWQILAARSCAKSKA